MKVKVSVINQQRDHGQNGGIHSMGLQVLASKAWTYMIVRLSVYFCGF